tara:strand:+ start:24575 stop:24736 length:162 start_codon:yes stop_codon:yes gene_type:complete
VQKIFDTTGQSVELFLFAWLSQVRSSVASHFVERYRSALTKIIKNIVNYSLKI